MSGDFGDALKEFPRIEYDIQPGETICAGHGGAEMNYDERAPNLVEEYFETQSEPGTEIFEHFSKSRGRFHELDEKYKDEDGTPVLSRLLEDSKGECIEMALVGMQFFQEDIHEVYLVNGSLPKTDQLNVKTPEHAYLILENSDEGYELFDPARLVGGEPIRGDISGIGDSNTILLEEGVQDTVESSFGRRYSLQ